MNLHDLQTEANNLLFLYYTSIGIIQRDCDLYDIDETMKILCNDIRACRERISKILDDSPTKSDLLDASKEIINDGKNFVSDAIHLIDLITDAPK